MKFINSPQAGPRQKEEERTGYVVAVACRRFISCCGNCECVCVCLLACFNLGWHFQEAGPTSLASTVIVVVVVVVLRNFIIWMLYLCVCDNVCAASAVMMMMIRNIQGAMQNH